MTPCWLLVLLCSPLWHPEGVKGWGGLSTAPSESECRPYIEKALKELTPENPQEAVDATSSEQTTPPSQSVDQEGSIEETEEATTKESTEGDEAQTTGEGESTETGEVTEAESGEEAPQETIESEETSQGDKASSEDAESTETQDGTPSEGEETKAEDDTSDQTLEGGESSETGEKTETSAEGTEDTTAEEQSGEKHDTAEESSLEEGTTSTEETVEGAADTTESSTEETKPEETSEEGAAATEGSTEETPGTSAEHAGASEETIVSGEDHTTEESVEITGGEVTDSTEESVEQAKTESVEAAESTETTETGAATESAEATQSEEGKESTEGAEAAESAETVEAVESTETKESGEPKESKETTESEEAKGSAEASGSEEPKESVEETAETTETSTEAPGDESTEEAAASAETAETSTEAAGSAEVSGDVPSESTEGKVQSDESSEGIEATPTTEETKESVEAEGESSTETAEQESASGEEAAPEPEPTVEDQLTLEFEAPKVRRPRDHLIEILNLVPEASEPDLLLAKTIDSTLKDLKKLYDAAIKPLEILFKYRDLSNRHFGDPEIFSKPLVLFMGPWSGGKSSIINYLLDNEFKSSSLRTGAEPSPAYFNILMWGEREEVLDGTQLAADWTFSGLQKFGQGLLDRLRGLRLNNPLLEKVNIVEIPGILEIRKQVERLFPFNDACQWFIDRADIIFLVYDPSKLDVGPETEAILDQLKGREYQTRIILNKADQVKPEELMRVQGTLIWNISPLMSSQEPPVMYSTSLWSIPYEQGAPSRLLHAQERAFLRDLRQAIDKRVDNKIASARRFAVRVRNHAKMVDCYLTTYYNHKSFFGNRKKVADDIIDHPQNYHIYEGLSTLTNISRYDLPDPEVYRDFFRLNALYDFQRLSDTCTYFRGCPINRLDVAIAYDLPELVGKYKKQAEKVLGTVEQQATKS